MGISTPNVIYLGEIHALCIHQPRRLRFQVLLDFQPFQEVSPSQPFRLVCPRLRLKSSPFRAYSGNAMFVTLLSCVATEIISRNRVQFWWEKILILARALARRQKSCN